jgi:hopanoid biosynthesis associated protein HpnK
MPKLLIVTADDFGLHEAVNEAVETAHRDGVLTAASLMVAAPAAADAVRRARRLPALRVGLHLVLADGPAVSPPESIPALVDAQGRFDARMVARGFRYFASPSARRQIEREVRAQFDAYRATGLPLDHVDAHKHFHLHPTLLATLLAVGADYGLRAVRVPDEPAWFAARAGAGVAGAAGALLLAPWLAGMRWRLRRTGIAYGDRVFGIARSGRMDEAAWLEILARLPDGVTEVYAHPAATAAPIVATMRDYRHADELAALRSPHVRAAIEAAGARLGGYGDLDAGRAYR